MCPISEERVRAMVERDATIRLEPLFGKEGLERLARSVVLVLGLGGVGSSCVEALARGGVGTLVLLDKDLVEPSNINRQALAFESTVGMSKVEAMTRMVLDINPHATVIGRHEFLPKEGIASLIESLPPLDYVVDAIDTISQKLALAKYCEDNGIRLVSSMGGANKLDPTRLRFADIHKTVNCHMSRDVRKECRKRGIRHLQVLFSDEEPSKIVPNERETGTKGSLLATASWMPPIMGQMIASKVLRDISGVDERIVYPGLTEGKRRGGQVDREKA